MADLKITLAINWGAAGWSETNYTTGDVGSEALTLKVNKLIATRACLFAAKTMEARTFPVIQYYRTSVVNAPNQGLPTAVPAEYQGVTSGLGPGDRRNYPYATGYAGAKHRAIRLRGCPSAWIFPDADVRYGTIYPSMAGPFEAYAKALKDGGFGMLVRDNSVPLADITAISVNEQGYWLLTIPTLNLSANQKIVVRGVRGGGTKKINGIVRVKEKLTGNVYVIAKKKCDECGLDITNLGGARLYARTVSAFTRVEFSGWSSGKLGRAFFSDLGRQQNCCR